MKKVFLAIHILLTTLTVSAQTLHIYRGENHDVYLGCLNCNNFNATSIWNGYGSYRSKYGANSIWNPLGTYGSKYNSLSPWKAYSSSPPVIVDANGSFYGYFTVNKYKPQRADFGLVSTLYECHEFIKDDISKWYDKIFG